MEKYKNTILEIHDEVEKARCILLVVHKSADGDAIGAQLALSHYLDSLEKEHVCFSIDALSANLEFLPKSQYVSSNMADLNKKFDLIITLDSSSLDHTGIEDEIQAKKIKLINIDHHVTNGNHGAYNLVIADASSTCEVLHHFLDYKKAINKNIAICLLTGIITDTGGFQNMATTPLSVSIASRLMNKGVNINQITKYTLQHKPVNTLKLWGRALTRLKINKKNNVISTIITNKDLEDCNANEEALEGISNFLNEMDEAQNGVVMVLSEREPGVIKGSLRTTNELIDVSKLATILGGGGHKKAAGFSIDGNLKETKDGWKIV